MKKLIVFFVLVFLTISTGFPEKSNEKNSIYTYGKISSMAIEKYVSVPIVGINEKENPPEGILGSLIIGILKDKELNNYKVFNEKLILDEKTKLDETTIKSILDAIDFIENRYNTRKSYFISYDLNTISVSGASSGSSVALGLISLFESKNLKEGILITGSIDKKGKLLPTGGVLLKTMAAEKGGFSSMIVPKGQGKKLVKLTENVFKEMPANSKVELIEAESIQTIDLNLIFTS